MLLHLSVHTVRQKEFTCVQSHLIYSLLKLTLSYFVCTGNIQNIYSTKGMN